MAGATIASAARAVDAMLRADAAGTPDAAAHPLQDAPVAVPHAAGTPAVLMLSQFAAGADRAELEPHMAVAAAEHAQPERHMAVAAVRTAVVAVMAVAVVTAAAVAANQTAENNQRRSQQLRRFTLRTR
jgi:hypothetical protein